MKELSNTALGGISSGAGWGTLALSILTGVGLWDAAGSATNAKEIRRKLPSEKIEAQMHEYIEIEKLGRSAIEQAKQNRKEAMHKK